MKTTRIQIPKKPGQYNVRGTVPVNLVRECHLSKRQMFHWNIIDNVLQCVTTKYETPTTSFLQETPGGQFFIEVPKFYKKMITANSRICWKWKDGVFIGNVAIK